MSLPTKNDLISFEHEIADLFNAGKIRAPVHLTSGNEDELIELFSSRDNLNGRNIRGIEPNDWVCCQWRSHYHCLLKGVPPETLKAAILDGRSIALCFPEQRVICSAIAGGILPIALGIAIAIKRAGSLAWVHCFIGDMTGQMGIAHECMKYATGEKLPIRWIVEDNGLSVCTETRDVWKHQFMVYGAFSNIEIYKYRSVYPHAGAGVRVQF